MNTLNTPLTTSPGASPAWLRWAALAAGLTLLAWSFGWQSYQLYVMTQVLIYGIAIMGLNLLTGYTGQISLGHSAFFAIGAYTAAVLSHQLGWPFYVGVPVAALLGAVVTALDVAVLTGAPGAAVAEADTAAGAALGAVVEVLAQAAPLSKAADRLKLARVS